MTREEVVNSMSLQDAIQVLKDTNCYGTMDIAKTVILKALEQEPCTDAISRQVVLEAIEDDNRNGHYSCFASNNDAECFKQIIRELPSVTPQEPRGEMLICPECGLDVHSDFKKCPRCGAKMQEVEE